MQDVISDLQIHLFISGTKRDSNCCEVTMQNYQEVGRGLSESDNMNCAQRLLAEILACRQFGFVKKSHEAHLENAAR